MQIFLPYSDFVKSLDCLDKKRCFKQLIEVRQVLATNGVKVPKATGGYMKPSYKHHPIHKIWGQYPDALMYYHDICMRFCITKWKIKTKPWTFSYLWRPDEKEPYQSLGKFMFPLNQYQLSMPWCVGYKPFHDSHKSNLLRKDSDYYSQFAEEVPDNLEYIWEEVAA
jgi:hypothetical protein